jgi:hypothetical protein
VGVTMEGVNCGSTVLASTDPSIFILGTREEALPLRQQVERALDQSKLTVCVDFSGITVTQSFIDEFIGVLILRRGPAILQQVAFRQCSEEVQAVIRFVVSSRIHDFNQGGIEPAHA